jgi:excisionase family DNA binding protein
MIDSPWLTREEAAAYLKINERTLDRYRSAGQIQAHKLAGTQSIRYRQDELDGMLKPVPAVADDECCVPDAIPAGAHITVPAGTTTRTFSSVPAKFRCANPECKCNGGPTMPDDARPEFLNPSGGLIA